MRRPGGAVRPAMKPAVGFHAALLRLVLEELRGVFFGRAADLADHDDRLGLGVGEEHFEHVDVLGALDRVAADADGRWSGRGPTAVVWLDRLIGQRARARDNADRAALVDVAGHDADLAGVRA